MSESTLREGIRKNAFFIGLFILLLGFGVYRYSVQPSAPSLPAPDLAPRAVPSEQTPTATPSDSAQSPEQTAEIQHTVTTIAEHQKKLDANPNSEEAPGLLNAMGNLNLQRLGDYKEAARCYDLLISKYPEWPGVKPAYHQLATCFQRLGDKDNEQRVYKTMMKVFPEDSQEYAYAKKQLGL